MLLLGLLPCRAVQVFFFLMLFQKSSREALLGGLAALLPSRLPGLARPPAEELRHFIDRSIAKYQAKVRLLACARLCVRACVVAGGTAARWTHSSLFPARAQDALLQLLTPALRGG